MEEKDIEIPYLEFVLYNQVQARELWLDYTESILMHYFAYILPTWWESEIINWKKHWWLSYWKIFDEMPTLNFKETTLRKHINKLIKEWLLSREIVWPKGSARAFYRVRKKYFVRESVPTANFDRVYIDINSLLEEGRILSPEKLKLEKLLSSYKGKTIKNKTTYNLEWAWDTDILKYLKREFELSEKGEWVDINIWEEINLEFALNLTWKIIKKWELKWWIPKNPEWKFEVTEEIKGRILSKLMDMFDWHKSHPKTWKKTTIKDFTWKINTFFWRNNWI